MQIKINFIILCNHVTSVSGSVDILQNFLRECYSSFVSCWWAHGLGLSTHVNTIAQVHAEAMSASSLSPGQRQAAGANQRSGRRYQRRVDSGTSLGSSTSPPQPGAHTGGGSTGTSTGTKVKSPMTSSQTASPMSRSGNGQAEGAHETIKVRELLQVLFSCEFSLCKLSTFCQFIGPDQFFLGCARRQIRMKTQEKSVEAVLFRRRFLVFFFFLSLCGCLFSQHIFHLFPYICIHLFVYVCILAFCCSFSCSATALLARRV